jgi:hypothetical protein
MYDQQEKKARKLEEDGEYYAAAQQYEGAARVYGEPAPPTPPDFFPTDPTNKPNRAKAEDMWQKASEMWTKVAKGCEKSKDKDLAAIAWRQAGNALEKQAALISEAADLAVKTGKNVRRSTSVASRYHGRIFFHSVCCCTK